jgi:hypothetical protein
MINPQAEMRMIAYIRQYTFIFKPKPMDQVIQPTIVLLILSLVTEKMANFYKTHSRIIAHERNERERSKKIQFATILIGIGVALVCKLNLFEIFRTDFVLFWNTSADWENYKWVSNVLGSVISGFFLSLGSKFFHDLLDLLLEAKNLKKKMSQRTDLGLEAVEEFGTQLSATDNKHIRIFLDTMLLDIDGVKRYELNEEKGVVRIFSKSGLTGVPKTIPFKTLGGKMKLFKVNLVEGE